MSIADELEKLNQLRIDGAISEEEYRESKEALLKKQNRQSNDLGINDVDENMWSMFIHISQFATYISFGLGIVLPIILWLMKKNQSAVVDQHGCNVINWMISAFIYAIAFALLSFILIGIPFMIALCIVAIVFPIVGAVKANDGEVWRYPFTITFISPKL